MTEAIALLKLDIADNRGTWRVRADRIESYWPRRTGYGGFDGSVVRTTTGDTKSVLQSPDQIERLIKQAIDAVDHD